MVWRKKKVGRKAISASEAFLDAVLKEVRFAWDRQEIREELKDHIEDLQEEFHSDGAEKEYARQRAIAVMGDARQVGKALNREHHFVLGYLWLATRAILVVLALSSLFCAASVWDSVYDWNQQGNTIRQLEHEKTSYTVQKIDRDVEMKHCTFHLKSLIRTKDGDVGGYVIYSIKKHWRDGGFINAERIEISTDADQWGEEQNAAQENPSMIWNVKGRRFWRQYRGTIMLQKFPGDAKILKLGYHIFGEDWDLKIPLEGVDADA